MLDNNRQLLEQVGHLTNITGCHTQSPTHLQSYFSSGDNFSFSFYIILKEIFLIFISFSFLNRNNSYFYLIL